MTRRIRDIVPRGRCLFDDFKCSSPGDDELSLFDELATLASVEAAVERLHIEGPVITLHVRCGDRNEVVEIAHRKYSFPPTAIIAFLDRELELHGRPHRLVPCRDGSLEGEAVVLASPEEIAQLAAFVVASADVGN
jgi:hypothetical protein